MSSYPNQVINKIKQIKSISNELTKEADSITIKLENIRKKIEVINQDLAIEEDSVLFTAVEENRNELINENNELIKRGDALVGMWIVIQKQQEKISNMLHETNERFIKNHLNSPRRQMSQRRMSLRRMSQRRTQTPSKSKRRTTRKTQTI